jgi:hypothetical protein
LSGVGCSEGSTGCGVSCCRLGGVGVRSLVISIFLKLLDSGLAIDLLFEFEFIIFFSILFILNENVYNLWAVFSFLASNVMQK